ncbi:conjugal transfer ATPase TrbE [Salmonella enterica subsp. enterica]|uniref:Conjugal transfer ATPase TrbE n=1 Tax=Salmonella enterica I TaxID=59201 RepID=A0A379W4C4_SALET|nr:conjugal transfer ATPase TrbE [Salmonella enterica subsp. enterica]
MTRCLPRASASGSRRCARRTSASSSPRSRLRTSRIRVSRPRSSKAAQAASSSPTTGDRAADSHDLRGLRPQQAADRDRRHRAAQARLLLPIPPRHACSTSTWGRRRWPLRGASTPQDQRAIDEVLGRVLLDAGTPGFAGAWLRHRGLDWAADLLPSFPGLAPGSLADQPLENLP